MLEVKATRLKQSHHLQPDGRLSLEVHRLSGEHTVGKRKESGVVHLYAMAAYSGGKPPQSI